MTPPILIFMTSGAGHGGRGGQGEGQLLTGAGYGDLFEPSELGCRGGAGLQPLTGGRGAGFIHMTIHDTMKVDGEISCNGEAGQNGGGGGSGGSVWIHTNNMQVKQGRDQASVQARGLKKAFSTSLVQVIGASISARLLLPMYKCLVAYVTTELLRATTWGSGHTQYTVLLFLYKFPKLELSPGSTTIALNLDSSW